jgi:hypothetical protein
MYFREHPILLKGSMSARSAVQKRPETRPKHYENVVFSPRSGAEKSAKEFFNTLTPSETVWKSLMSVPISSPLDDSSPRR